MDALRHLGHLGPVSTLLGCLPLVMPDSSQVGENRWMNATLQPQRVHFPSLIVCPSFVALTATITFNQLSFCVDFFQRRAAEVWFVTHSL